MKSYLQIKTFDEVIGDNESQCNKFIEELGCRFEQLQTVYNSILGGVIYIVLYHK